MESVTKKPNVPALRFPEFSGEWTQRRLETSVSHFQAGEFISASEIHEDYEFPVYGGNGLRGFARHWNSNDEICLIGRQGALCGNVRFANERIWVTEHAIIAKPSNSNSCRWLYYLLTKANLNGWSESSAQPGLSAKKLLRLKYNWPELAEQEKVAVFLTAVDERFGLLKRKKELLEEYKKGVMQRLFSREIRFKDEEGNEYPEWKEKRLGEVGSTFGGLSGKSKEDFGTAGARYVQYMQVYSSNMINLAECDQVALKPGEKQNRLILGDALFTTSSETPEEIGISSVVTNMDELPVYLNSFCFGFRMNVPVSPVFLAYRFRAHDFRRIIAPLAQGSTRFNLSKSNFLKLSLKFPSTEEQVQIGEALLKIDKKINRCNAQIVGMSELKKGLLQKMFV
jgi:type I restriction enzyme S subunit